MIESGNSEKVQLVRPTINSLLCELESILDWQMLMIHLGVEKHQNDKIEKNFPQDVDRQKQEAFDRWLRGSPNACWKDIIDALFEMEENVLAGKLTRKYCWKDPRVSTCHLAPLHKKLKLVYTNTVNINDNAMQTEMFGLIW